MTDILHVDDIKEWYQNDFVISLDSQEEDRLTGFGDELSETEFEGEDGFGFFVFDGLLFLSRQEQPAFLNALRQHDYDLFETLSRRME